MDLFGTKTKLKKYADSMGLIDPSTEIYIRLKFFSFRKFYDNLLFRIQGAPDKLPIPSGHLIYLVIGTSDVRAFLESGKVHATEVIEKMVQKNGFQMKNF